MESKAKQSLASTPRILVNNTDKTFFPVRSVHLTDGKIVVVDIEGTEIEFPVKTFTPSRNTDTIVFESGKDSYALRRVLHFDGPWTSTLNADLPVEAIENIITKGTIMSESLTAYTTEDGPYVVGLVYTQDKDRYSRIDGEWMLLAPTDDTYDGENIIGVELDPVKANSFIDLYDANYVSVSDLSDYEGLDQ